MESINVVVDDEETGSLSKGEKSQPIDTSLESSSPVIGMVKPPPSPQDEQVSPPQITSPQEAVPTENLALDSDSSQDELDAAHPPKEPSSCVKLNHPQKQLLGDFNEGLRLRNRVVNQVSYNCYLSQFEPKKVEEALQDESWVAAMHDELHQFIRNDVWAFNPRPPNHNIIGTKWIFKKKFDEHGTVVRNKVGLVV